MRLQTATRSSETSCRSYRPVVRQDAYSGRVKKYVNAACSVATRRAYAADIAHFIGAGYRIPCREHHVAEYLAANGGLLAPATLRRRLVAIQHAHIAINKPSPVASVIVKTVMRGIVRSNGAAQRRVKAVDKTVLGKVLKKMAATRPKSLASMRDQALLLVGFAGAFRRSELVALDLSDIVATRAGINVTIRWSKTDQEGAGRTVPIPRGKGAHCPVRALRDWLRRAGIDAGAVFRAVSRHGHVSHEALTAQSVGLIVKKAVAAVGLDPREFGGHSLRAGYVTTATVANVPVWQIKQVTGHRSNEVLERYVRLTSRGRMVGLL